MKLTVLCLCMCFGVLAVQEGSKASQVIMQITYTDDAEKFNYTTNEINTMIIPFINIVKICLGFILAILSPFILLSSYLTMITTIFMSQLIFVIIMTIFIVIAPVGIAFIPFLPFVLFNKCKTIWTDENI